MKALLISEHEEDAQIIANIVKTAQSNIQVILADGPEQAMDEAGNNGPFGIYILDVDLKDIDVNALGLNLIEFTGARPILFIGTEQLFKDRIGQDLYNSNEYNQEIFKPVEREEFRDELSSALNKALGWVKKEEFAENVIEIDPSEYVQMKLRSFYMYEIFPYDIYLPMTSTCYVKIISADKTYSHKTLAGYARRNVRHLYIKKDDHLKFLETESKKCLKALKDIKLDHKDIYLVFLRSISIFHEFLNSVGPSAEAMLLADKTIETIIHHFEKKVYLTNILKIYPTYYQGISSKSLLTAFISIALGNLAGWESITTKKKLVISSLLQDFNLKDDLLSKINYESSLELKNFPEDLRDNFLGHPVHNADVSKLFTAYPDIDHIIENHHELPSRKGFPHKPSLSKLTQINAVFNIAQCIAAEIDGEEINNALLTKTLKGMSREYAQGVFKETLKQAQKALKMS